MPIPIPDPFELNAPGPSGFGRRARKGLAQHLPFPLDAFGVYWNRLCVRVGTIWYVMDSEGVLTNVPAHVQEKLEAMEKSNG